MKNVTIPLQLLKDIHRIMTTDNAQRIDGIPTLIQQLKKQPDNQWEKTINEYTWNPHDTTQYTQTIKLIKSYITITEYIGEQTQ